MLGPLARRTINRFNATTFGVAAQLIRAAALLPFIPLLAGTDNNIQPILELAFLAAVPVPFIQASQSALLRSVVPPRATPAASRALSITGLLTAIAGPVFGAVAYGVAGTQGATLAAVGTLVISSALLLFVRPSGEGASPEPDLAGLVAYPAIPMGPFRTFGSTPLLPVVVVELATALLAGGLVIPEAAYTVSGLFVEVDNVITLLAAQGAGAIIGIICHGPLAGRHSANALASAGLAVAAGGVLGLAISESLPAGAVLAATFGLGLSLLAPILTRVVSDVRHSQDLFGATSLRAMTQWMILLSVIVAGPLCDTISPRFTLAVVGVLLMVLALYSFGAVPEAVVGDDPPAPGSQIQTPSRGARSRVRLKIPAE